MIFRTGLLLFFLSLNFWSFSQVHVRGKIIDKEKKAYPDLKLVLLDSGDSLITYTNRKGEFELYTTPGNHTLIIELGPENSEAIMVAFPNTKEFQLKPIGVNETYIQEVVIDGGGIPGMDPLRAPDFTKLPRGPISLLTYSQPVNSNNELTSNYNVRGGNYDENLVYVNGFLVNRPFLTRSGQQEGMSFINTLLVEKLYFSAGGFQAVYGDKLSSVLAIKYRQPDSLKASVMAGLLGIEANVEDKIGQRFRYLFGARYRSNGYLLNSLPTKGNYNPVYWDAQLLTTYDITERWRWSVLGHTSSNRYQFSPQTQQTDFGTSNEAFAFNIYFDGQEDTRFLTSTVGTSFDYGGTKYKSTTYFTAFHSNESENFDIQGQYFINELETDPSKENYGDSIAVLGIGTFLNHARNQLNATILSAYHDASYTFSDFGWSKKNKSHQELKWGAGIQLDDFSDRISEWRMIDSAGYSLPQGNTENVQLFEVIKAELSIENQRTFAYAQHHAVWHFKRSRIPLKKYAFNPKLGRDTLVADSIVPSSFGSIEFDGGARAVYTSYNDEFFFAPRASLSIIPVKYAFHNGKFIRRSMKYRFAAGVYNQPPFYREFRRFDGTLNPGVKSQKSAHFVTAVDYSFYMWKRAMPFKFTAEAYYKYLWDINPYEIENVRIRYYADNLAKGYATGMDLMLNGEFVPGLLSFFKVSLLSTKENLLNDQYTNYYNQSGEVIVQGISQDQVAVDSAIVYPGYIRRPSDQHLNVGMFFQDNMPGLERLSAQLGLNYGSRLPYGPPDFTRYKDTLTMKAYFRVDLGLTYDLLASKKPAKNAWQHKLSNCFVSFEVYNLLGYNNVLSKQWIQDVSGKYYSVPNYLTSRRFNLKFVIRF